MLAWLSFRPNYTIQAHPLPRPLPEWRVALIGMGGAHLPSQQPFNLRSRLGDDSFREISTDPNCVFPLDKLRELEREGLIGSLSPRAFSLMGYIPRTERLLHERAPEVAAKLKKDQVDLALIAPA